MNNFDSTLRVLHEGKKFEPTEDEILDFEEDYNLRCGKKFIAKALSIIKQFPKEYSEKDAVKWCKTGKGEIPEDVQHFLQKQKWDKEDAAWQKRRDKEDAKADREANKPPKGAYTDEQMAKHCKAVGKDWAADNDTEHSIGDVAYDLADAFMYPGSDPKAYAWVQWKLKSMSKSAVKEWIADSIVG